MSIRVWYRVRDLDAARAFYTETLRFSENYYDADGRWARLSHGAMEIGLAEGDTGEEIGVATIDVADIKAEAERLRAAGVNVGTILELHGEMRLLDVFDPEGNRIQLAQSLAPLA